MVLKDRFETEAEQRAYTIGHSEGYEKGRKAALPEKPVEAAYSFTLESFQKLKNGV